MGLRGGKKVSNEDRSIDDSKSSRSSSERRRSSQSDDEPTLQRVPSMVEYLESAEDTSAKKPTKALRHLFAISEHSDEHRTEMVLLAEGKLVPVLLGFMQRCSRGSSEQYLSLLVLNNISIPAENKRLIALEHGGAGILSQMLCDDPACHLVAIVLVNLTFADAELRREIVTHQSTRDIIPSLAFALRMATFTAEEYEAKLPSVTSDSAMTKTTNELLASIMPEEENASESFSKGEHTHPPLDPSLYLFPETARWCLCAMKNLTYPSRDTSAIRALIQTKILPLIMSIILVGSEKGLPNSENSYTHSPTSRSPANTSTQQTNPSHSFPNFPTSWDCNSVQDSALHIVMNLAAAQSSRAYILELSTVHTLSTIMDYHLSSEASFNAEQLEVATFQQVKAKMALSYLLGSEGHFGQSPSRSTSARAAYSSSYESLVTMSEEEVDLYVELFGNILHDRSREGTAGYSAASFNVKNVIFSLRCLLTLHRNVPVFASRVHLNVLLLKALAMYAVQSSPSIDSETAEHICFSLYLMSNYGFKSTYRVFLPDEYGEATTMSEELSDEQLKNCLASKVLNAYYHLQDITPAGKHACLQLLRRLPFLGFDISMSDLNRKVAFDSDLLFDTTLLQETRAIDSHFFYGVEPISEIFHRPILRSRAPTTADSAPWDDNETIDTYSSALHAAQELSFGSTKVRHLDGIDDVLIANNIAKSANGEKVESYQFWWTWQDISLEIRRNFERQRSGVDPKIDISSTQEKPFRILDLACNFCAIDTTSQ